MIIYIVINQINGKIYIGQTINSLQQRKKEHIADIKKRGFVFHRALNKYGIDNFKWQVICICPNIDILNEQEEYYIAFYNSMDRSTGYNLTSGGLNCIVSEETKRKHSEVSKGEGNPMFRKKALEETKRQSRWKMSKAHEGKKLSEITKTKISIALIKYWEIKKGKSYDLLAST